MICPHCQYKTGWHWEKNDKFDETEGEHGDFWKHPVEMEQTDSKSYYDHSEHYTIELWACPACHKAFVTPRS